MSRIEASLFTVSLDDHTIPPFPIPTIERPDGSHLSGHLRNTASGPSGANRWFDKSFSLILESNARFGMMGEHSPVDALVPSIIADWSLEVPIDPCKFTSAVSRPDSEGQISLRRLNWVVDQHILDQCKTVDSRVESVIKDSDARELWFDEYGAKWIREGMAYLLFVMKATSLVIFLPTSISIRRCLHPSGFAADVLQTAW